MNFRQACASARTVNSANGAPTTWSPIGRPDVVKPQGTEIAVWAITKGGLGIVYQKIHGGETFLTAVRSSS